MLISGLAAVAVLAPQARAQSGAAYDYPVLPLSEALARFGKQSGFHLNYDEALAEGRAAGPVRARSPHEALSQLLAGTGLVARFTRRDAFTIVPRATEARPDMRLDDLVVTAPVIGEAKGVDYAWYGSLLLEECFRKLREQRALKGRRYELQLYVWLDRDGAVTRLETLGPLDQVETRLLVEESLAGLRVASLPPQAMPQPIRLRISAM
ncbi:STN domain-containing protein [Caulobacter mirabilis]|uniref:Secretin/TonB short N-terminal domain-containing protein n=1 Tax=Caulobacter mirabilis TaxID=69666 RepID=A0A2D2B302_9CAUL|nr:STN domain-containing protein [Caulobacter mirabilis]ATQ44606.1 hypothetical protein CSW64_20525 [Caulobacter mirabilis]